MQLSQNMSPGTRDLSRLKRYAEFEKNGALVELKTVVGFSTAPISTYVEDV